MILQDKRTLITGVMTADSIAFSVAEQAQRCGGEVALTSFGRARRLTQRAARGLPRTPDILELDVNREQHFERLVADPRDRWGGLDGALHAIAFANEDAFGGDILRASPESAGTAFQTVAWPAYDWMGVAKAALEAVSRYLTRDLGSRGVRVNLVSAGPLKTVAQTVCFLLSDWSRAIGGEIIHVDGGFHAIGAAAARSRGVAVA